MHGRHIGTLLLVAALAVAGCASAGRRSQTAGSDGGAPPVQNMTAKAGDADRPFWELLAALEQDVPTTEAELRSRVAATLAPTTRTGTVEVELTGATSSGAVAARLPGGSWLPPPPPGWGPKDAEPAYVVDRKWGRIFLAFRKGVLRHASFDFGSFGSPGI